MSSRAERIAKNEALFREVNERIREVTSGAGEVEFLCECGDDACTRPISVSLPEYEQLRANPAQFAIAIDHEIPEVEDVVSQNERFAVVEKHAGAPAAIANKTNPRS